MTINPAKRPGFNLLKPLDDNKRQQLQSHYQSLIEYSRKSDMTLSPQYIQMYQEYSQKSSYEFGDSSNIQ